MTALELFTTLRDRGVRLTPNVTTVHVDAPRGVLTPDLRQQLTHHKQDLLHLVEEFDERPRFWNIAVGSRVQRQTPWRGRG